MVQVVPTSFPALVVTVQGRWMAIPQDLVAGLATVEASPPLPLAQPWVAGLAHFADGPRLLLEPFGAVPVAIARRTLTAVAIDLPGACPLAVVVDGPGTLATVALQPAAGRISIACPATWLRPAQRADGSAVLALMAEGLADTFARAA